MYHVVFFYVKMLYGILLHEIYSFTLFGQFVLYLYMERYVTFFTPGG